jgi:alpha-galactosidase
MSGTVHLGNGDIALSLWLPERGMPEILSFGPEPVRGDVASVGERAPRINGMDRAVPSAVMLPAGGMGFFGWPAIAGHRAGRDFVAQFSSWTAAGDTQHITLTGHDAVAALELSIEMEAAGEGVVTCRSRLRNAGEGTYSLDRIMAATMLVPEGPATLTSFTGMWGREMHAVETALPSGLWLQESRRGRTSHDRWPGLFVSADGVTFGVHLGWSGNHVIAIDTLDDGRRLIHAGQLFEPGEVQLAPGQSHETPIAYLTAAEGRAEAASARYRRFVSGSLLPWPPTGMPPRPVLMNTWEGNYFDHRLDRLTAQADAAAALGVERFVLDDGWFGRRDDDTSSLGDWQVDPRKYPKGLGPLIDHVTGLGMQFGLWVEPEMVNPRSDLFSRHPEWALQIDGRELLTSRHQHVLDLTRPEVSDYLFGCLDALLGSHAISYLKWDMNRDLTHVGDAAGRAATTRQTNAVYALIDRVRAAHPDVEIESCASGGGRMDYGVLGRTTRVWASDGTDALERLEIQRGVAHFLPPEVIGAHVSAIPNHQTHRRHTLAFRAIVALAYHLGIELDPSRLSVAEADELSGWIALHKRLRPLLHGGGFFQQPPVDGRYVWGVEAPQKLVLFVAQGAQMMTEQPPPLRVPAPGASDGGWRIAAIHPAIPAFKRVSADQDRLLSGQTEFGVSTLRRVGLPLPALVPESAIVLEIERIAGGSHG